MAVGAEKYNRRGLRTSYISTVIGVSLVLFMIGLVLGGYFGLENIQKQAKESLQADIFFAPDLTDADIKQIEQELKTWSQFSEVMFVSQDRALEEFIGLGEKDEVLALLDGENPIPTNISYKPKEEYASVEGMAELKKEIIEAYGSRIETISYQEESVESVNLGFKQFVFLFGAVALLLIIIAVAMINNTIRLALYSKRFSIKTMQLVGATSSYIRKPFLIQSMGIGFISGIIGTALLMALFYALNNALDSIEISYDLMTFGLLIAILILIGIIISYISTWFALNKYLRMKLDDLY
ncbi:MAG: FtsX-like permease family protein [Bacteroidetes bacterium]|nr:MAG: FtsX-like permease family protein [Bacteroidota bacterium]TNE98715.1 MAG: FtsX-like permease family protein [Bacteroidota bacterium]